MMSTDTIKVPIPLLSPCVPIPPKEFLWGFPHPLKQIEVSERRRGGFPLRGQKLFRAYNNFAGFSQLIQNNKLDQWTEQDHKKRQTTLLVKMITRLSFGDQTTYLIHYTVFFKEAFLLSHQALKTCSPEVQSFGKVARALLSLVIRGRKKHNSPSPSRHANASLAFREQK